MLRVEFQPFANIPEAASPSTLATQLREIGVTTVTVGPRSSRPEARQASGQMAPGHQVLIVWVTGLAAGDALVMLPWRS